MPLVPSAFEAQPTPDLGHTNPNKIGVFPAWPYANGPRHLGHGAALVVADVLARYHRSVGDDVLMVSGTDEHGTPNVIAAEKQDLPTIDYVTTISEIIREDFTNLGMSFDRFSRTTAPEHAEVVQIVFTELLDKGYIEPRLTKGSFDAETDTALPDRYVEGECPSCAAHARGDQCENCSTMLDPQDLINPVSTVTGNPVEFRDTEHYFLLLDVLAPQVEAWLNSGNDFRSNAQTMALSRVHDMPARAITRDMQWGVPLPENAHLDGADQKVLYVWFEAVLGYLSASIQWAQAQGKPEAWREWWQNPEAYHYYVMGKDNIPFHTLILPAMILGINQGAPENEKVNLPNAIASTEYLTLGEGKFSSSRGNTLYLSDMSELVGPDALRYYLVSAGPETSDVSFSFEELVRRTNNELGNNWGNLVHRVTSMTVANMGGEIPTDITIDDLAEEDQQLLQTIDDAFSEVGEFIHNTEFRKALQTAMKTSAAVNAYLYEAEPWKKFKDPSEVQRARQVLFTAQAAITNLAVLFSPFMPHSSQKILDAFHQEREVMGDIYASQEIDKGFVYSVITGNYESTKNTWRFEDPKPTSGVEKQPPLFPKLDKETITQQFDAIATQRALGRSALLQHAKIAS